MSYMHIPNLYKAQEILLFRECYALEKVHGTSAHISWRAAARALHFFAGGCKHEAFEALFDHAALTEVFGLLGTNDVTVFGEAYGGKLQGMSKTYGPSLRFIVFEVKIGDWWLDVPNAADVARKLGLDFVPYRKVSTDLGALDAERDRPSEQSVKCGIVGPMPREGIVLRPLVEVRLNNGDRIVAKHKGEAFQETSTPRPVTNPDKIAVLADANAIAAEWVTPMRLAHVLDAFGAQPGIEQTGDVIRAMIADVEREAAGEIVLSREAKSAIGRTTAQMFKTRLQDALHSK